MSKRDLKKYISGLNKSQLQEQITDLYDRFKNVKEYYDFVFNPQENKLVEECKFKITKEYFPVNGRKPKARRSIAQKYIKHFITIGLENSLIADIMLYNIEIAQSFSKEKYIKSESFYISIQKSFEHAVDFIDKNNLLKEFSTRIDQIVDETWAQEWFNKNAFTN